MACHMHSLSHNDNDDNDDNNNNDNNCDGGGSGQWCWCAAVTVGSIGNGRAGLPPSSSTNLRRGDVSRLERYCTNVLLARLTKVRCLTCKVDIQQMSTLR